MINYFSSFRRCVMACAAFLAFFACSTTLAGEKYGPDDEAEVLKAMQPKVETEAPLPNFPDSKDLIPVDAGPTAKQTYLIDAKSLSVTPDDIVRYTVVATSSAGAKNIIFEGISCHSFNFTRYAYGMANGKWVRAHKIKWVPISSRSENQLHYTLTQFFFCRGNLASGTKEDILSRLRNNRPLSDY